PPRALEQNVSGMAYLCCTTDSGHDLSCHVALEQPRNYGFGDSALRTSRDFRIADDKLNQAQASPTHVLPVAIEYDALPLRAAFAETRRQTREQAHDICGPGTDSLLEEITVTGQRIRR